MAVLVGLGFASGLPLMLTGRTMRLWARDEGVNLEAIGLLSLVALPYSLKFLWAPLLDRFTVPILGRRRGWIIITQFLLMVAIAGMGLFGPHSVMPSLRLFVLLAVATALFSASQDIVADAYRTDILEPHELGAGASLYMMGYRGAMLASGAGAVFLADYVPWTIVYVIAACGMLIGMCAAIAAPEPPGAANKPASMSEAFVEPIGEFFARNGRRGLFVLLFIVTFKLPDYMAAAMNEALLLDLGFSKEQISIWALGAGVAVTLPGVALGGLIITRLGLWKALLVFGLAQAASNGGYLWLAKSGQVQSIMISVIALEYFCMGMVVSGFVAFLMSQCNRRYSAAQFALLSSLMGVSAAIGGAPTGYLVNWLGYEWFFIVTILVGIPGLAMLPLIASPREALVSAREPQQVVEASASPSSG